ncbi:MAG: serine/threonine protein kinase, partial [Cyanobacteria bacterium HKST-UBA02]|nr:serine/threonine protein kinase [Cyanobacteria bacterium HKST-UBA02]
MRHRDLPERYVVISELGSGGMGSVYLVTDSVLNKHVAVKVLSKPVAEADPVSVRRFQREARAAGNLNHENIVKILDFGVNENEQPYLVMEHFDGLTLEDMIGKGGPLSLEIALEIFSQVCRAISHTHENGIVHRDLKSSNILVRQDNTGTFQVKLIDFGIACFAEQTDTHSKVTTGNAILGSPLYMSPEQAS